MRLVSFAMLSMFAMTTVASQASDTSTGLIFSHEDWQLACDNTRTCRAAGYSADGSELPVSILLTRKAGERQAVTGKIMIGNYNTSEELNKLPRNWDVTMRLDGKVVGKLQIAQNTTIGDLSDTQLAALLPTLRRASKIKFTFKNLKWTVSDLGAVAVLLKMDEFQGRIGTTGALIKKGVASEGKVLPALPTPIIAVVAVAQSRPEDTSKINQESVNLIKELQKTLKAEEECMGLDNTGEEKPGFIVNRLNHHRLLVSTPCWRAFYNSGHGYWVINEKAPFKPTLVTLSGSDYSAGTISANHKGRGLGDCWSSKTWQWDGSQFILSQASETGMCRLITYGGAWDLPSYISTEQISKP